MKNIGNIFAALLISFLMIDATAQDTTDSTGFPGDHFSLEGALELFKKAESLEAFEKSLNTEDNNVNNLDLNEDGETDYIRVIDNMEEDVHAIVLQVPVSEDESQDIAVIAIEKTGNESAVLQILGDEEIYGEKVIVEPYSEEGVSDGRGGPSADMAVVRVVINVWAWPSVKFVYAPAYRPYISPWRWRVYPRWWKPWRPRPLSVYVGFKPFYRGHYHVVKTHRVVRAHNLYVPKRKTSVTVRKKTTTRTVVKKDGKVVATKKTTTTKKVGVNKNGKVTASKKTTSKAGLKTKNGKAGVKKTKTTKVKKGKHGVAVSKTKTTKVKKRRN